MSITCEQEIGSNVNKNWSFFTHNRWGSGRFETIIFGMNISGCSDLLGLYNNLGWLVGGTVGGGVSTSSGGKHVFLELVGESKIGSKKKT